MSLEEIKQYYSRMESLDEYTQGDIKWLIEQAERAQELEEENKRYREAREIIEQVYKENYVRNANVYGYEDGYLDGLDTAIDIIDKALEESE